MKAAPSLLRRLSTSPRRIVASHYAQYTGIYRTTATLTQRSIWTENGNTKNAVAGASESIRFFSEAAAKEDGETPSSEPVSLSSPKLDKLYQDITKLNEEEVHVLGALIMQVLGRKLFPGEFGRGLEGLDIPIAAAAEEEEEKVEKTTFNVKLMGFDAKAKIKVIKEVRAIAGLGLKEAKELVESAPKVIGKDLKQDKA
eukprot:CAMPEP_0176092332 /NCGR_PEP_ID=MMETSP0120_2-20121206/46255_1 /TAXON_ID=160619 /ORGANISM="Kryptoperidinium foliaceum, Strain CCMP 1326" /LENGTH=198 /DNA_ID=CAMNT_0017426243 /DNA_START=113 /DNA_END=705 /DNA_ORIENTATION=+